MKTILGILALLSLFALVGACNRNATKSDENIQREETIRSDDLREKDSFNRTIPRKGDEMERDREEIEMGTQDTSVAD